MKRVLLVIALKVAEIGGVLGIWYLLCLGGQYLTNSSHFTSITFWVDGALPIALVGGLAITIFILYLVLFHFFKANWKWAGRILKK